jgi:tRNA G18 (ribose-2'-O)-methylase SpoU
LSAAETNNTDNTGDTKPAVVAARPLLTEDDIAALSSPGVGPWEGVWPSDSRYDPELLAAGDHRNVIDAYRYWSMDAIRADLAAHAAPLHVAIQNWEHDFNIGSIVRTANAFGVSGVHIVGRRRWNRRGAMVTDRYLEVYHHEDETALANWCTEHELALIGVDNLPGSVALETAALPGRCCLVFGSEGAGLTDAMVAYCRYLVAITQYGSTRSLNAGAAAAITMYHWSLMWRP